MPAGWVELCYPNWIHCEIFGYRKISMWAILRKSQQLSRKKKEFWIRNCSQGRNNRKSGDFGTWSRKYHFCGDNVVVTMFISNINLYNYLNHIRPWFNLIVLILNFHSSGSKKRIINCHFLRNSYLSDLLIALL